jgi:hypothetical protein
VTSYAVQSGTLPTGISLNTSTGAITGTPTALKTAANVTIRATGPGGTSDAIINIAVLRAPVGILGADLHRLFVGDGTLWQDSGRTTPATSDGDPVGAWDDASGNAGHAVQATAGARPTIQTAELNSKAVVRLDGTDDNLEAPISADASKTIWVVVKQTATIASNAALLGQDGGFNTQFYVAASGTAWAYYDQTGIGTMAGPSTSWGRVCLRYTDASTLDIYINGSLADNGDPQDNYATGTALRLGDRGDGGSPFNGDIAEVIVASAAATAQQLLDIDAYLVAKYGL